MQNVKTMTRKNPFFFEILHYFIRSYLFSYWGSYELTIPGGSGSGNAVQHLNLPENAPEFFQVINILLSVYKK